MQDEGARPVDRETSPLRRWFKRLETTKVTVLTVVLFIGALGVMCMMAAVVGYFAHRLRH